MSLPIENLSISSIRKLRQCSEAWRRRYIEREYEPSSGAMTIGKAVGAAETQSDAEWIANDAPLSTDDVLDVYADEWDVAAGEDVDWRGEKPAALKDSGAAVLKAYHDIVIPETPKPIAIERRAQMDIVDEESDTEVGFVAYLDLEVEGGVVIDRKATKSRWSQEKADKDAQATGYLASRRAEAESFDEEPASAFAFDTMVRTKSPYAERIITQRTDDELDHFLAVVTGAAREIAWRIENDAWSFAPDGAWWCSEKSCGYWSSCPGGGLYRRRAAQAVREA